MKTLPHHPPPEAAFEGDASDGLTVSADDCILDLGAAASFRASPALSSLFLPLGTPELEGVATFGPVVPDVVELESLGVCGRDTGLAAARAESSARGSSSSVAAGGAAGLLALGPLLGLGAAASGVDEGMSSN